MIRLFAGSLNRCRTPNGLIAVAPRRNRQKQNYTHALHPALRMYSVFRPHFYTPLGVGWHNVKFLEREIWQECVNALAAAGLFAASG